MFGSSQEFEWHHLKLGRRRPPPPHTTRFPSPETMKKGFAVGWVNDGDLLVARFGYRLKSDHWKVDNAIHSTRWVLRRGGVLRLKSIPHREPSNDHWLDNAWLSMRNHAG